MPNVKLFVNLKTDQMMYTEQVGEDLIVHIVPRDDNTYYNMLRVGKNPQIGREDTQIRMNIPVNNVGRGDLSVVGLDPKTDKPLDTVNDTASFSITDLANRYQS